MARNEEKALTLFNRWQTFKKDFHSSDKNKHPLGAAHVMSLGDAESRRREIVREMTKKVSAIENATLGEVRIRELNDDINKLAKQKTYWEIKIRELGGDATKGRNLLGGEELPGVPGYRYYGAAKNLPGVRELFEEARESQDFASRKRTRGDIFKGISPDYYGYRDEDDGSIVLKEKKQEEMYYAQEQCRVEGIRDKLRKLMESSSSLGDSWRDDLNDEEKRILSTMESNTKGVLFEETSQYSIYEYLLERNLISGKLKLPENSMETVNGTTSLVKKELENETTEQSKEWEDTLIAQKKKLLLQQLML